jgi:cytochrome c oxidase cbb3-type subunit 1
MYSAQAVEWHFWLALAGLLTYVFALWNAGITQGLMWRTYNAAGTLNYSFIDSMEAMRPYYIARVIGGALFLAGICVGAANIWLTVRGARGAATDAPLAPQPAE